MSYFGGGLPRVVCEVANLALPRGHRAARSGGVVPVAWPGLPAATGVPRSGTGPRSVITTDAQAGRVTCQSRPALRRPAAAVGALSKHTEYGVISAPRRVKAAWCCLGRRRRRCGDDAGICLCGSGLPTTAPDGAARPTRCRD